jgi:hypothetical protein
MVFGFGKKKPPGDSFKKRVTDFWEWYPQNADRLFGMIESGSEGIAEFMTKYMEQTMPGLAWVFGPGEPGGHSFTVSGEGIVPKQLLAEYWHSRARQIPRWTFHASRQATPPDRLDGFAIGMGGGDPIDVINFLVQTTVNAEAEVIDLVAWHPAFAGLPEDAQYHILYLLLDEALGEFGTEMWLGEIKVAPLANDQSTIKLSKLPEKIAQVNAYYEWEKVLPIHGFSLYEMKQPIKGPRGDTLFGTTSIPNMVLNFIENKGKLRDNPLAGTGAQFAYVTLDGSVIPPGEEVDARSRISDSIAEALEQDKSGLAVGGAYGAENSYIDLILFDGQNSEDIVTKLLDQLQLTGRSSVHRFG